MVDITQYRQRMYSFVIYQLSGIQAGIQAGHATGEYSIYYGDTADYKNWLLKDKTVIILGGGTTNCQGIDWYSREPYSGSMQAISAELKLNKIKISTFYEPDLNNALTAISFLVDERVWDLEKYPDPLHLNNEPYLSILAKFQNHNILQEAFGDEAAFLRTYLKQFNLARN